jgi:hypothetical protein
MSQFKYLGMTVTDQNLILDEINRRLNSGNACYHSVQNLLSSRLLSNKAEIRIYKCGNLHIGNARQTSITMQEPVKYISMIMDRHDWENFSAVSQSVALSSDYWVKQNNKESAE